MHSYWRLAVALLMIGELGELGAVDAPQLELRFKAAQPPPTRPCPSVRAGPTSFSSLGSAAVSAAAYRAISRPRQRPSSSAGESRSCAGSHGRTSTRKPQAGGAASRSALRRAMPTSCGTRRRNPSQREGARARGLCPSPPTARGARGRRPRKRGGPARPGPAPRGGSTPVVYFRFTGLRPRGAESPGTAGAPAGLHAARSAGGAHRPPQPRRPTLGPRMPGPRSPPRPGRTR